MQIFGRLTIIFFVSIFSTPSNADWIVRNQGVGTEIFTENQSGSAALVLSCRAGKQSAWLSIIFSSDSGWAANSTAAFDIDGTEFAATVDAFDEGVRLSDLTTGEIGISDRAIQSIRRGDVLTLDGPAAQKMPEAARRFDLTGSSAAIEQLTKTCAFGITADPIATPTLILPLRAGEFTSGACTDPPDVLESVGIYILTDGAEAGQQFISPNGEGITGFCHLKEPLSVSDNVYSGSASCESGGRASTDLGAYNFSYQIINEKTFISNGTTYSWCVAHR